MQNIEESYPLDLTESQRIERARKPRAATRQLVFGLAALLAAVPIAFAMYGIHSGWPEPEKAVQVIAAMFAVSGILPAGIYLTTRRSAATLSNLGLIVIATVSTFLAASYLFAASFYIALPADVLIWSESDFVNDILKFHIGYPIFTAQVNNESFTYVPGSQLLTYFFAWLSGNPFSVTAYRAIQLGYTFLAAIVAFMCCRRLVEMSIPAEQRSEMSSMWGPVWLTGLFLIATNSITNPFSHLLHNDSLAQLVTVTAYWLLIEYTATRDKRILWLMILIPALGFWVKQSLVIWVGLYGAYLLIFDRPRSFSRVIGFGFFATLGVSVSMVTGYLLWGENFTYWTVTVLGSHGVSPLRSFRHLLLVWPYLAIGLLGGLFLLKGDRLRKLLGPWLIWLVLISTEIYTSGIAWMLNHIGPGCLLAGIWFFAAVTIAWNKDSDATIKTSNGTDWLRIGVCVALVCLLFSGLGVIRVPVQPFIAADAERYVNEIEGEFRNQSAERTLLDVGTWVYVNDKVVMKDRAPSIGERGYSQTGDFSGIHDRLRSKYYEKILVRNLHLPDFWYDHESWSRSSGLRQTFLKNYEEVRRIRPVEGFSKDALPYGFGEISVLVPRTN